MLPSSSSKPTLETWIPRRYNRISMSGSPIEKIQRTLSDSNMKQISISTRQQKRSPCSVQSTTESVTVGGNGGNAGCKGRREKFSGWEDEGKQSMDDHYRNMVKAYPQDALFLTNYAKFLKEVQENYRKAEEYCERAILMKANDGEFLAMYAELIQINHKDEERAQFYLDLAIQASPENCLVLGSYALNLWDSEE